MLILIMMVMYVDINNDGYVNESDVDLIADKYGNETGESTFNEIYDIKDDGRLDVRD